MAVVAYYDMIISPFQTTSLRLGTFQLNDRPKPIKILSNCFQIIKLRPQTWFILLIVKIYCNVKNQSNAHRLFLTRPERTINLVGIGLVYLVSFKAGDLFMLFSWVCNMSRPAIDLFMPVAFLRDKLTSRVVNENLYWGKSGTITRMIIDICLLSE